MNTKGWKTCRRTDPNDPTYVVRDFAEDEKRQDKTARLTESSRPITTLNKNYGPVAKAKPAGPRKAITGVRNLNTEDIEGAQTNSLQNRLLKKAKSFKEYLKSGR